VSIRYDRTDLPMSAITGVTTSHIGGKQGFATTMTARALRNGAESGAAVSILGMFEQGFYDRFGFGTANYVHLVTFDPQSLMVDHIPYRAPTRLTVDDASDMSAALAGRLTRHGGVTLDWPDLFRFEWGMQDHTFALGYRADDGRLTHFVYGTLKGENGPFRINFIAYETTGQLMELLRLLRELGDQIHSVRIAEPPDIQLQALIETPIRQRNRSMQSDFESGNQAIAWWQLRMLDLDACVAARRWPGEPVRFNLVLTDPVEQYLDADDGWAGISGSSTITVGDPSSVSTDTSNGLPTLTCDVGAFTRLWFGVRPASSLVLTDRLDAPPELCEALDEALRLPPVLPGTWF